MFYLILFCKLKRIIAYMQIYNERLKWLSSEMPFSNAHDHQKQNWQVSQNFNVNRYVLNIRQFMCYEIIFMTWRCEQSNTTKKNVWFLFHWPFNTSARSGSDHNVTFFLCDAYSPWTKIFWSWNTYRVETTHDFLCPSLVCICVNQKTLLK